MQLLTFCTPQRGKHGKKSSLTILIKHFKSTFMLELNNEKEGFMAYIAPEDAQRPRAVYTINPDIRGI